MQAPEDICPDFPEWPDSWEGVEEDVPYGEGLLAVLRPFVEHLILEGLRDRTIRNHMDNLWLLGGEIIRAISIDDNYKMPPIEKLRESVDELGGPICRHLTSPREEQSYNATCKKLHKFLKTINRFELGDGFGS